MMIKNRICLIILTLIMILGLVACGTDEISKDEEENQSQEISEKMEEEDQKEKEEDEVEETGEQEEVAEEDFDDSLEGLDLLKSISGDETLAMMKVVEIEKDVKIDESIFEAPSDFEFKDINMETPELTVGSEENIKDQNNKENSGEINYENAVFIESISTSSPFDVNDEKLAIAIEKGIESPETELDVYLYTPKETDVINFNSENVGLELGENLIHKGFSGLEVTYVKKTYAWNDFFGDLDYTEFEKNSTVSLKGKSIFEFEIEDEYMKNYRYFDEKKGLYYELKDFMVGNFLDEDAELTNERLGYACNYNGIDGIDAPTYNDILLKKDEEAINYFITVLDNKPCVYIETTYNGKFYKKWIDIEFGLLVKELAFDSDGLLADKKVATSISEKDIDESIFNEPKDIEFKDITMFIFSLDGGDLETLFYAMQTIPSSETGIKLESDDGAIETIYTTGMGDEGIDDVIYYHEFTLNSGEKRSIRQIKDDRFYTICDELKKVEIFDKSYAEKKFFNFEDVGLMGVETIEDGKIYTFYDPNNISVSALYNVYQYVIKNNEFTEINYYQVQNIANNEPMSDITTYKISLIDFDENIYDESCLDTYEIIDRGENSFDDGEWIPFWLVEE